MTQQLDRDVRFSVHRVAGSYDDAVTLPVQRGDLAFGLVAGYDRNERRGRLRQGSQLARRLEDDGSITGTGGHVFVLQQTRDERDGLLPRVGRNGKGTVARLLLQPLLQIARVQGLHRLPIAGRLFVASPLDLALPVARRHEYEGASGPLVRRQCVQAGPIVVLRLPAGTLFGAEFPA